MKEQPILFNGDMIRAIIGGRKSQTRRVLKGSTEFKGPYNPAYLEAHSGAPGWKTICPYGVPGDRLWVRETHIRRGDRAMYRADVDPIEAAGLGGMYGGWTPSIFMFRKHSRITLELTDVRVQRLQDISEEDAKAEGVKQRSISTWWNYFEDCYLSSAQQSFSSLWQSINGKNKPGEDWDAWDANPWVWAVTFKVVRP